MDKYFARLTYAYKNTEEEKRCSEILFNDIDIAFGDQRLNQIAALTWNAGACDKIFALLDKTLSPTDNPWKTIYKALLIMRTVVCYGSEKAVDSSIQFSRTVLFLQDYNSALVKKGLFSVAGGTDYGAPVRAEAKLLTEILRSDDSIRTARANARNVNGSTSLVPVGMIVPTDTNTKPELHFGQGLDKSLGAKYSMEEVPGLYAGRPDRYFDNLNDPRNGKNTVGNAQHTRDALAPDLLDLSYDSVQSSNLPEAQYLPGLEKQKELERQLQQQQEELLCLKSALSSQAAVQPQQSIPAFPSSLQSSNTDLLSLSGYSTSQSDRNNIPIQAPVTLLPNAPTYGSNYPPQGFPMNIPQTNFPSNIPNNHSYQNFTNQTMPGYNTMSTNQSYPSYSNNSQGTINNMFSGNTQSQPIPPNFGGFSLNNHAAPMNPASSLTQVSAANTYPQTYQSNQNFTQPAMIPGLPGDPMATGVNVSSGNIGFISNMGPARDLNSLPGHLSPHVPAPTSIPLQTQPIKPAVNPLGIDPFSDIVSINNIPASGFSSATSSSDMGFQSVAPSGNAPPPIPPPIPSSFPMSPIMMNSNTFNHAAFNGISSNSIGMSPIFQDISAYPLDPSSYPTSTMETHQTNTLFVPEYAPPPPPPTMPR